MKKRAFSGLFLFMICFVTFMSPAFAAETGLVDLLTKNLGVTSAQAEGGAGAIFNTASQKMSVADFAKVTDAMPEVKSLMAAAPAAGNKESGGFLSGISSNLGEKGSTLGSFAKLSDTFSKLELSGDMVGKFIPIILQYAQNRGGDGISGLLKSALQ